MPMEKVTLYDLQEYTKRVIALNFSDHIWVSCEISQINNSRGNYYLNLIQKEEGSDVLKAQASAAIWYKSYLFIKSKLGQLTTTILQEGQEVLLKVRVDFNEVYGMKLVIEDVDPTYTIGSMEIQRQKTLDYIQDNDLQERNKKLTLPSVIQRVAVISSERAAGYADFKKQIEHNDYGYDVILDLYSCAVQGNSMEREILAAFEEIEQSDIAYDIVVIIRGGGSRMDLAGFDKLNIAVAIAKAKVPVWTGIGHEVDDAVADIVAHTAFKTPTAVAAAIIDNNLQYEMQITEAYNQILRYVQKDLAYEELELKLAIERIDQLTESRIQAAEQTLLVLGMSMEERLLAKLKNEDKRVAFQEMFVDSQSPERLFRQGYVYVRRNGTVITMDEVNLEDKLEIIGAESLVEVQVLNKKERL